MKIKPFTVESWDGTLIDYVEIEIAEGQFQSMPKSVYDEQQAALKAE